MGVARLLLGGVYRTVQVLREGCLIRFREVIIERGPLDSVCGSSVAVVLSLEWDVNSRRL